MTIVQTYGNASRTRDPAQASRSELIRRTGSRPGDVAGRLSDGRFALLLS